MVSLLPQTIDDAVAIVRDPENGSPQRDELLEGRQACGVVIAVTDCIARFSVRDDFSRGVVQNNGT